MNDIIRLNNELKGINMKKRVRKVIFRLALLSAVVSANCIIASFAVSEEAIFNEMMRKKSRIDLLCKAIDNGDLSSVKFLAKNFDVNQRDYNGDLPLYAAVLLSNDDYMIETAKKIVDLLLKNGADPFMKHEKGISVLELFKMADRSCFNEIFAKYGFDVSNEDSLNNMILSDMMRKKSLADLLCEAIFEGDYDLAEYIVKEKHCCVNEKDYKGRLPLYVALLASNSAENTFLNGKVVGGMDNAKKIVDLLLQYGADPFMTSEKGMSVLEQFKIEDKEGFNEIFAKYGFDIS